MINNVTTSKNRFLLPGSDMQDELLELCRSLNTDAIYMDGERASRTSAWGPYTLIYYAHKNRQDAKKISGEDRTTVLTVSPYHTLSFICDSSGCLIDLPYYPDSELKSSTRLTERSQSDLIFRGMCRDCLSK